MERRVPAAGTVLWLGVLGAWLSMPGTEAHAQLGFFGNDSNDGGDDGGDAGPYPFLRPRKLFSNPWKADAGPQGDAASGVESAFAVFRRGSYVKDRAPAISALTDEDGGLLSSSASDGGKSGPSFDFDFELPSFGADIDAGPRDVGPVVAPDLRVALPREHATPLTAQAVPPGTRWARLPDALQPALRDLVKNKRNGGFSAFTRAEREALWVPVDADARLRTRWGFILGEGGAPVPARLLAVGVREDATHTPWFYGAWAHPRGERAAVGGVLVFTGSRNMGPWRKPAPLRTPVNANFHRAVGVLAQGTEAPVGIRGPLKPGRVDSAVIRAPTGTVVEVLIHEANPPAARPELCMDVLLSAAGHVLRRGTWSPLCDPAPVTATDADGDGVDEVLWRVDGRLSLRTYPQGTLLDEDPPAPSASPTQGQ